MTKKDYVAIAKVIREQVEHVDNMVATGCSSLEEGTMRKVTLLQTRASLAETFAFDNPRFDRETFKKACGI